MKRFAPALLAVALMPAPALSHPHIFIDAGLELRMNDDGQLTHIKVTWAYDAFYSLLMAEDRGLDPDGNGELTEAEQAQLAGFDANWIPGFNGDLVVRVNGEEMKLSGPLEATGRMVEGRIVTTHIRDVLDQPTVKGDGLSVKAFDETYYTAYDLTLPVKLVGGDACEIKRFEPNVDNELSRMQSFLLSIDANADLEEMDIPMMGESFATDVRVVCPAS